MTTSPDPWGPYRATIEDQIDVCADYLGRLRRSLSGEIAPDRAYFADKAHQLHTAARRMVRTVQDVDRWLGECAAPFDHHYGSDTRIRTECALPAGHTGAHNDAPDVLPASAFAGQLRDFADVVERVSHEFGDRATTIDRGVTGAPGSLTASRDALANLSDGLDTIGRRARRLSGHVRDTALDMTPPDAVDSPGPTCEPRQVEVRAPSIEL